MTVVIQLPHEIIGTYMDFEFGSSRVVKVGGYGHGTSKTSLYLLTATNGLRSDRLYKIEIPTIVNNSKQDGIDTVHITNISQVLVENDEKYFLDISASKTHSMILLHHQSKNNTQVTIIDHRTNDDDIDMMTTFISKQQNSKAFVQHGEDLFFILQQELNSLFELKTMSSSGATTNRAGLNISATSLNSIWRAEGTRSIEDFDVFDTGVVVYSKYNGKPSILYIPLLPTSAKPIDVTPTDAPVTYDVIPALNTNFYATNVLFSISSSK
jgi:protease II